jgi:hypothetical protein
VALNNTFPFRDEPPSRKSNTRNPFLLQSTHPGTTEDQGGAEPSSRQAEEVAYQLTTGLHRRMAAEGHSRSFQIEATELLFAFCQTAYDLLQAEPTLLIPETDELLFLNEPLTHRVLTTFAEGVYACTLHCHSQDIQRPTKVPLLEAAACDLFEMAKQMVAEHWLSEAFPPEDYYTDSPQTSDTSENAPEDSTRLLADWMQQMADSVLAYHLQVRQPKRLPPGKEPAGYLPHRKLPAVRRNASPVRLKDVEEPCEDLLVYSEIKETLTLLLAAGEATENGFSEQEYAEVSRLMLAFLEGMTPETLTDPVFVQLRVAGYRQVLHGVLLFMKGFFHAFRKCREWSMPASVRRDAIQALAPDLLLAAAHRACQAEASSSEESFGEIFFYAAVNQLVRQYINRTLSRMV